MTELACEIHGPLRWHDDAGSGFGGPGAWTCSGFDGEGCLNIGRFPLSAGSYERCNSGVKYWPGTVRLPVPQKGQEALHDDDAAHRHVPEDSA